MAMRELDDGMWNPDLEIPLTLRNLEPIWKKLNKVHHYSKLGIGSVSFLPGRFRSLGYGSTKMR